MTKHLTIQPLETKVYLEIKEKVDIFGGMEHSS